MRRANVTPRDIRAIRGTDTQMDFARLLGASCGCTISRWEHGVTNPSRVFQRALVDLARKRKVELEQ